ncbi:MAG: prolipoprotein diacylglyceryl transferase family protein [Candidatus Gottesmanbacteria bacterium]
MMPILFSIGTFHVFSFSIVLIIAWFIWSFTFWRHLRSLAITEERIFDAMFATTLMSLVVSRFGFVVSHPSLFSENWLRVVALWVQPGLSLYGALIGAVLILVFFAMKNKIRVAHMLDAFSLSFMWAYAIGLIGGLLDGSTVGKQAVAQWAIPYVGHVGLRHPIQLYSLAFMIGVIIVISIIRKLSEKYAWSAGSIAMWFFSLFSLSAFAVEFFIEHAVYLGHLSANQWILVGIFGQSLGAFYVRGGGKERLMHVGSMMLSASKKCIGGMYAKFSKRHIEGN